MALNIRKVSRDQLPKSNVPGRVRQPSDFDDIMAEAFEDREWRGVPYDGTEETLEKLTSELGRAVTLFDSTLPDDSPGAGKSIRVGVDEETQEPTFYFQIRDKLKTGRRKKSDGSDPSNGDVDSDIEDETDGEGVPTAAEQNDNAVATSIEDAKSAKRSRKSSAPTANFSG